HSQLARGDDALIHLSAGSIDEDIEGVLVDHRCDTRAPGGGPHVERLTGLDASFLYNETPTLHMHTLKYTVLDVSTVPGGYDFERFRHELDRRLHLLPPFRRRIVQVPGQLHHPVWIEDPDFDLGYHVRRMGVPAPGGREQ